MLSNNFSYNWYGERSRWNIGIRARAKRWYVFKSFICKINLNCLLNKLAFPRLSVKYSYSKEKEGLEEDSRCGGSVVYLLTVEQYWEVVNWVAGLIFPQHNCHSLLHWLQ